MELKQDQPRAPMEGEVWRKEDGEGGRRKEDGGWEARARSGSGREGGRKGGKGGRGKGQSVKGIHSKEARKRGGWKAMGTDLVQFSLQSSIALLERLDLLGLKEGSTEGKEKEGTTSRMAGDDEKQRNTEGENGGHSQP